MDTAHHDELFRLADTRVLVVDDNLINRQLLTMLLQRGGVGTVETAEDGAEALARLSTFRPDMIVLDLMMPKMDGFEMCRRLRADPDWADTPVLVQSSLNRSEDRAQAFGAGATDYVVKPINPAELLSRVRIHLQNRALVDRLRTFRRRTEQELAIARRMQERLLPTPERLAAIALGLGVTVDAEFHPSSELGGDVWDLRQDAAGRLIVLVADFSGHGVGAALNTFRLHAMIQRMDFAGFTPAAFLDAVNRRLCGLLPAGQFATMLAGVLDLKAGRFDYASAGAPSPMAWAPGDFAPTRGDGSGLPLGLVTGMPYETRSLAVPPEGRLFFYSDAAIEIPRGDDVVDEPGLAALVADGIQEADGRRFLATLRGSLERIGPIDDDLTLVLLTRS